MQNSQRSEATNIRHQDVEKQIGSLQLDSISPTIAPLWSDPLSGFDGDSANRNDEDSAGCKDSASCKEEAYYSSDVEHRDVTACGHIDQGEGRRCYWQAACACGWVGERWGVHPNTCDNADLAHREYHDHVVRELGPQAFYDALVACRNCGSEHIQPVIVGTHVTAATCCRCGTRMLDPRNDAWDASRALTRRWFS